MKVWMINYALSCPWNILNVYRNHTCMIACLCTRLVFYPKSGRRWCTTPDDGRRGGWGRHKTDVMRDWEWKARKRGNMIENEASTGIEAWMGFAPLARRQDLTWGIHQSISTGRPNFCSGWSVTTENYFYNRDFSVSLTCCIFIVLLDWQSPTDNFYKNRL